MLSASEIFPSGFNEEGGYVRAETNELSDRIGRVSGVVNIVLGAVGLALAVFGAGLLKVYQRLDRKNLMQVVPQDDQRQGCYLVELTKLAAKGLASYDISANSKYAPLIANLNRVAEKTERTDFALIESEVTPLEPK
jgi:hypothetical protein